MAKLSLVLLAVLLLACTAAAIDLQNQNDGDNDYSMEAEPKLAQAGKGKNAAPSPKKAKPTKPAKPTKTAPTTPQPTPPTPAPESGKGKGSPKVVPTKTSPSGKVVPTGKGKECDTGSGKGKDSGDSFWGKGKGSFFGGKGKDTACGTAAPQCANTSTICGTGCCDNATQFCAQSNPSICCLTGEFLCHGVCVPIGTVCCANVTDVICNGSCCATGQICASTSTPTSLVSSICCASGQVNCNGVCTASASCCGLGVSATPIPLTSGATCCQTGANTFGSIPSGSPNTCCGPNPPVGNVYASICPTSGAGSCCGGSSVSAVCCGSSNYNTTGSPYCTATSPAPICCALSTASICGGKCCSGGAGQCCAGGASGPLCCASGLTCSYGNVTGNVAGTSSLCCAAPLSTCGTQCCDVSSRTCINSACCGSTAGYYNIDLSFGISGPNPTQSIPFSWSTEGWSGTAGFSNFHGAPFHYNLASQRENTTTVAVTPPFPTLLSFGSCINPNWPPAAGVYPNGVSVDAFYHGVNRPTLKTGQTNVCNFPPVYYAVNTSAAPGNGGLSDPAPLQIWRSDIVKNITYIDVPANVPQPTVVHFEMGMLLNRQVVNTVSNSCNGKALARPTANTGNEVIHAPFVATDPTTGNPVTPAAVAQITLHFTNPLAPATPVADLTITLIPGVDILEMSSVANNPGVWFNQVSNPNNVVDATTVDDVTLLQKPAIFGQTWGGSCTGQKTYASCDVILQTTVFPFVIPTSYGAYTFTGFRFSDITSLQGLGALFCTDRSAVTPQANAQVVLTAAVAYSKCGP